MVTEPCTLSNVSTTPQKSVALIPHCQAGLEFFKFEMYSSCLSGYANSQSLFSGVGGILSLTLYEFGRNLIQNNSSSIK